MKQEWISTETAMEILGMGRVPVNHLAQNAKVVARRALKPHPNGSTPWEFERSSVETRAARMAVRVPTEAECGVDWMPFQEACSLLGLSRNALYERIEKGFLRSARFGPAEKPAHFVDRSQILVHLQAPPHQPRAAYEWRIPDLTDEERGWFGGIVDGEGCISLICIPRKSGFQWHLRLTVVNTDPLPIEFAMEHFGGARNIRKRPSDRHKATHCWQANCAAAGAILRYLRPSIRMKARQADLAIQFQAHLDSQAYRAVPADVAEWRNEQLRLMHELNRRGS